MTTLQAQIPDQLLKQAQYLVNQGWVTNMDELITEAMRRYLESHREAVAEQFIREDANWNDFLPTLARHIYQHSFS
ncbi:MULTISPECIES: ribbon-helix-helix domain-containing protein [Methylomonas]|uniref:CopG family transcriptional regulator n=1 Tax=Methylomonas koyamae TaxID=702114 RepID=A0A291IGM4_9GAMM|nr:MULTISPECIES: ribbon-helix-helix domain-containing protein [Methylomonas]ANE54729.1 CopG family transcriptional regulator [Methylomonas sp. DH-1]ATG89419.1 hypothetical protein MKLM6_1162 [Methylomonas koyamae]OAI29888.1 CopG family transcriptional regulator [Methylomonas koyamae]